MDKGIFIVVSILLVFSLTAMSPTRATAAVKDKKAAVKVEVPAVKGKFDISKMSDMSDFDPNKPVIPTGDTIKIAIVGSFSGPAAAVGELYWSVASWVSHDINKRGGILVDGKKKLVQIIKADHMSRPDQCKKICEQMVLQEKVCAFWGTDGSNMAKIMNEVADKYHVISQNFTSLSDELMNAQYFSRYAFMTQFSTSQVGRSFAYFYGQIRKKEKKFYILNQDYMYGHDISESFKKGLKEYYPQAQIVGEDYHKLFLTDFAPYLSKIKASGAEVIYSGDWYPDSANLLKQARQMGVTIPFAHVFMGDTTTLTTIGIEGSKGLQGIGSFGNGNPAFKTKQDIKLYKAWNDLWKTKFKAPYNEPIYEHGLGRWTMDFNWLLSVIERAGSTDPEKIIKVWEGDTYQFANGQVVKMRACDHMVIEDIYIVEFVPPDQQRQSFNIPPYYWSNKYSFFGPASRIPAEKVLPWMDPKLERCKGKSPAGD
jgi:ABC-type branched-subunit amino acid transport system substrate-binding protein